MRFIVATAIATLALSGCASSSSARGQSMSCAGGHVSVAQPTATPGEVVEVTGKWFVTECGDVVINGVTRPTVAKPHVGIAIEGADGVVRPLATVTPDPTGGFSTALTIPGDTPHGAAKLIADGDYSAPITIQQAD